MATTMDTATRTDTDGQGRARTEDTGHRPLATGHSPSPGADAPATRCPECGQVCADQDGLAAHCVARPACRARVTELLAAADLGYRICPRCDCAILGAVSLAADGAWVHRGCLTAGEREERGIEDEVQAAMAYAMRRAGAMPRPPEPAEVLP